MTILIGLGGCLVGVGYLQTYYTISQSDPADLRAVTESDDTIEVAGTAEPHTQTLRAPFTDSECVVHEIKAIELGMDRAEKRQFRERLMESDADVYAYSENFTKDTLVKNDQSEPFIISTDTGEALVEPEGAQ